MSDELVQILEGNTFVVSDGCGDIEASLTDPTGLFSFDTRFLSRWVLTVDGQRLTALSTDDLQYFQTRFFLVPGTGTVYVDSQLSVIRQREVANGFREELRILNHENDPVHLTVRIEAGSDFADLFEVKDALAKKGQYTREELASLAQTNVESLKEYDYFTYARAGGKKLKFAEPVDYWLEYKDGALTLHFTLPLKVAASAKAMKIEIYDPSIFVDFEFARTSLSP